MLPRPLVIAIAILVTVAWAANITVGFFDPTRAAPGLNTIFGIVVGSVFALDSSAARSAAKKVGRLLAPPPPAEQSTPPTDDTGSSK